MIKAELDRMRLVAREALSKQAEREARQRKMVAGMCRDNEFWNERPSFVHTQFSIHDALDKKKQAYKQAQRAINCLLSEAAAKATFAPVEKIFPIGSVDDSCASSAYIFEIGDKLSIHGEVYTLVSDEDFNRAQCLASGTGTIPPKEKTYSQAYMDRMQKANQSLGEEIGHLNLENIKMQRCLEASGEILENTTDELKESQAENELLRATVQSLLNSDKGNSKPCETVGKGS